jgi:hypothetical protein
VIDVEPHAAGEQDSDKQFDNSKPGQSEAASAPPHVTTYAGLSRLRARIAVSALIGIGTAIFCTLLLLRFRQGAADFSWTLRLAAHLLNRTNPYDTPLEQYPLFAGFVGLPFLALKPEIAAGVFYGLSAGVLAFGLSRDGWHRLLVFMAYPFWAGVLTAQWAPVIAAAAFFPLLLPVTMMKPQVGLPVAVTHLTRRGAIACGMVLALSLAIMPRWPSWWLHQLGNYEHFIPILVWPGPLLSLVLIRYRRREAWLLFTAALMPQRWFFDAFTLWLVPKSRRAILLTAAASWGAGIWRWYRTPQTFAEVGRTAVIFLYLPMLVLVLWPSKAKTSEA